MNARRFLQFASIFVIGVTLAAFPNIARADDDDGDGGDLFGDGSSSSPNVTCIGGGAGSPSCDLNIYGVTCSVTCRTGYYACCYNSFGPHCVCMYTG